MEKAAERQRGNSYVGMKVTQPEYKVARKVSHTLASAQTSAHTHAQSVEESKTSFIQHTEYLFLSSSVCLNNVCSLN